MLAQKLVFPFFHVRPGYTPEITDVLGSNVIVAGTAIFGAEQPDQVIATLKNSVETAQAKAAAAHV